MNELVLERRDAADRTAVLAAPSGGTVLLTPPVGENYWVYRVRVCDGQSVIGFGKFGTIGVGFAAEEDWNTNLPYDCLPQRIVSHIWHNRGPAADPGVVVRAVEMICWAAFVDRDGFREPYAGRGRTVDGARRSAQVDRSQAFDVVRGAMRNRLLESAARWDAQAERMQLGIDRSEAVHRKTSAWCPTEWCDTKLEEGSTVCPNGHDAAAGRCVECLRGIDGYPEGVLCVVCAWYYR